MSGLEHAIEQGPEPITRDSLAVPTPKADWSAPWDRLVEEAKDTHWILFEHYRDSGLGRSIAETVRWFNEHGGTPEQATITLDGVYKISSRYRWNERVVSWDEEQERLYQLARSQATREMVDRHQDQIEEALEGLMVPIRALNMKLQNDPNFIEELSNTSAKRLITLASSSARTMPALMSAERLARGMPTEVVGGTVSVDHNLKVERDHIGEVLDVLERAGVLDGRGNRLDVGEVIDAEVVDVYPVPAEGDD